jgi:hypothetical protein
MRDDDNLSKPLHSMSLRDIAAHNSYTDHDLHRMRLLDILDIDSRPTLIFDLSSPVGADGLLQPKHCSPSLLASEALLNLTVRKIDVGAVGAFSIRPYSRFRQWLVKKDDGSMRQLEEAHICLEVFSDPLQRLETNGRSSVGHRVFLLKRKNSAGFLQRRLAVQPSEHNIEQGAE